MMPETAVSWEELEEIFMFVQIKDIKDYIHKYNVEKLPITYDDKMEVNLFGNKILVERNEWL